MTDQYPRWQKHQVQYALGKRRVVLLAGARQCGKTTLAKKLSSSNDTYRTLDIQSFREAAEIDPHEFVHHTDTTMIIDEVQRVPSLLPAIKKVVDDDTRPGQYLLTGSANIQALPSVRESLAGRIRKVRLRPLAQGEILKRQPKFFEHAFQQSFDFKFDVYNREQTLQLAFRGGFPEAVLLEGKDRQQWHQDYIEALLERDLQDITRIQRREAMVELVKILAAWSSKFMDISAIGSGLSIRRPTVESYINALEALYLVEKVPAWVRTDYARVGKQKKLFFADSGLMSSLLNWRAENLRFNSYRIGKLIETFVFNELSAQIDSNNGEYNIFHYRDREQREIDFIVEREDESLLGVEVKASSSIGRNDFKHLTWFRENVAGHRPFVGIALYSGEIPLSFGKNLWGIPFGMLWPQ
ncbi:MAG: ATP-binding protein [Pseudomonadota bacterium]